MFKKFFWAFSVALMTFSASAETDQNIVGELQVQIGDLQRRVESLEQRTSQPDSNASTKKSGNSEDMHNWRQLRIGMNEREVESLLGEPSRVDMSSHSFMWSYPQAGHITFDAAARTVRTWGEPLF